MYVRLGCRGRLAVKKIWSKFRNPRSLKTNSKFAPENTPPLAPKKGSRRWSPPLFLAPFCFNVKFQGMVILRAVFLGCYSPKISTSSTNRIPKTNILAIEKMVAKGSMEIPSLWDSVEISWICWRKRWLENKCQTYSSNGGEQWWWIPRDRIVKRSPSLNEQK